MTILRETSLVLLLLLLTACNRGGREPTSEAPQTAPRESIQEPAKTPATPQIAVLIDQKAAERERLNARFTEAEFPPTVLLSECFFKGSTNDCLLGHPPEDEAPPEGQKWLVVKIEISTSGGEMSLPITQIRLVDDSKKEYPLAGMPGYDWIRNKSTFMDVRRYARFTVRGEPPELVIKGKGNALLLFAIPANRKGVTLRLGAAK